MQIPSSNKKLEHLQRCSNNDQTSRCIHLSAAGKTGLMLGYLKNSFWKNPIFVMHKKRNLFHRIFNRHPENDR